MENVIDIVTLRKLIPNVRLCPFHKRLIGADKKPISVVGSVTVRVCVNNTTKPIKCVAVRNLNTDFIMGMPGLRSMGMKAILVSQRKKGCGSLGRCHS